MKAIIGNLYVSIDEILRARAYPLFYGIGLSRGYPGLTVRDEALETLLHTYKQCETIYLSFDSELSMAKKKDQLQALAPGMFLSFTPPERIVIGDGHYTTLTADDRTLLLKSFFDQLDWLVAKFPNLVLAPIYKFAIDLPADLSNPTTYSLIRGRYPSRSLDLAPLLDSPDTFPYMKRGLTLEGYKMLKEIIDGD